MTLYNKELETIKDITHEAGKIMLHYFDEDLHIETKEDKSLVTIADKLINTMVIKRLTEVFPEDGVIGEEESTSEYGMGRKWVCDPIDGTAGYIWGTPTAMFSLALVLDGKPVVGGAYDPYLDKMYVGVEGTQSLCNDKPIKVSDLDMKTGTIGLTGNLRKLSTADYFKKLNENKINVASFSGAVYKACLVAKGKFAGFIEIGAGAHDLAAVHVIVQGAGGKITAVDGSALDYSKKFRGTIISNGVVHDELVAYCKEKAGL
ncbi:MAG: inositol monophosphatase [bacterium]